MIGTGIVEDMRDVNPVEYIRAVGLRPEDSYGFLPLQLLSGSSYFFLYRDRPEYEQARAALPESETVLNFDFFMGSGEPGDDEISPDSWLGRRITGLGDQAADLAKSYEGVYGAPPQPEPVDLSGPNPVASGEQIAQIEKLKAMGVLDDEAYRDMISLAKGGEAGPLPGGVQAAAPAQDAPPIVVDRLYPGLHSRSSTSQLDHFMPSYRDALGLCPEDVYGVFPRGTHSPSRGPGAQSRAEWDDFWIVYRDRPEYAQGRAAWTTSMGEARWPEAEVLPGVAPASAARFDGARVEVEKDIWPREKLVMRQKGSNLGDSLREKLGRRSYEPDDSFGFCPSFGNASIYFAWRRR
ncbi:MAG: hypothetical protein QOE06_1817 [Thermoleophilaceae bacterium]|jgi:hypothetical protein|nr:hypothetical protein [Thermoleophilaceae bacterium]